MYLIKATPAQETFSCCNKHNVKRAPRLGNLGYVDMEHAVIIQSELIALIFLVTLVDYQRLVVA